MGRREAPAMNDREVLVLLPPEEGKDWLDVLVGQGPDALRAARAAAQPNPDDAETSPSLTVDRLAELTGLPADFLLGEGVVPDGGGLQVTYYFPDGRPALWQPRFTSFSQEPSWSGSALGSRIPYGLQLLHEARATQQLLILGDEIDCLTAQHHHVAALGVRPDHAHTLTDEHLQNIHTL
jgi:hypothetical protein